MNLDLPLNRFSRDSSQPEVDSLFLQTLRCKNFSERPPVWIMRQAGRSLPSYREIRKRHSLEEMFRTPKLISTITRLPIDELGVDAAILFADILHTALPLGLDVTFPKTGGPIVSPTLSTRGDLSKLKLCSIEKTLGFVAEGIDLLKRTLPCPLIGFAGGPFTVATYLTGKKAKRWLYRDPEGFHLLLDRITQATIFYLKLQVDAGVDALQIFESWANLLSKDQFSTCIAPYLKRILDAFPSFPIILFCRGSSFFIDQLVALEPRAISFDHGDSLPDLRTRVPSSIAVQGNFDPELLHSSPLTIKREVRKLLTKMEGDPGFIVNLGHGILPDTPISHIHTFIETIKMFKET